MNTAGTSSTTSTVTRLSLPPGTSPISASTAPSTKVLQATTKRVAMLPEDSKSTDDSTKATKKTRLVDREPMRESSVLIAMVPWSHYLRKLGDVYVMGVLCDSSAGGVHAQYDLAIPLNPEECALALASSDSLEKLAARVRQHPSQYDARHIHMG